MPHGAIGYFNTEVEAAIAYDKKAKEFFGDFAYQNFTGNRLGGLS